MTDIIRTIDAALARSALSAAAASRLAVGNPQLIKNMRSGKGRFSYEALERLAVVLGLECYFGPPRDRLVQLTKLGTDDFVTVPLYEPTASAGPGDVVEGEAVLGQVAFRRAWLRRHGVAPDQAALFRVRGHSMAPTIPDRAVVLVDRAARQLRDRRVYVLRQDDALFLKRLRRDRRGLIIASSDNPAIDPFLLDPSLGDAPLVGEVRWFGATLS